MRRRRVEAGATVKLARVIPDRRVPALEPGATETPKRVHATHVLTSDGARCKTCGVATSWDRIEGSCPNRPTSTRANSWTGLSEAEKVARRAAKLRGGR